MSDAPYELLVGPLSVYVGPTGETFPDIDDAPAGNWVELGTSGDKNISEDGISVQHMQTLEEVFSFGSTAPRKVTRTREGLVITFTLMDLTAEEYSRILNHGTVSTVAAGASDAGHKRVSTLQGSDVTLKAWLFRGSSPYISAHNCQYELPKGYVGGEPTVVYSKGVPAGLAFEIHAIEDDTNGFGVFRAAHAAATG